MTRFLLTSIVSLFLLTPPAFAESDSSSKAIATFGGGCLWCMEPPVDKHDGVVRTISGFSGGHVANPSYKQVVRGNTGHTEVVQITYDPSKISYQQLLQVYWKNVDPLDKGGQFCDRGWSYRPVIFTHNEEQQKLAEASRSELDVNGTIAVPVESYSSFYAAEDYHQDYYLKNPVRYKFYRYNCGRDKRLQQVWGE
ncbi:MAG: peptide-methionine (S)-S-oxide reductase MsrA [Pseudomonadota bacterium]|nr:peptide-methionine (S)-S-oxide reductase MsrA [Pseudomonadota bacterium]